MRIRLSLLTIMLIASAALYSCAPVQQEVVKPQTRPVRVAVVLGAGAARGFAHIGVLKVLESNKVPVDMVVGTSAGSLVGSLYASGIDAYNLQKLAMEVERDDIIDITIPNNGFIKGEKLAAFVNKTVKNAPIEKLKIPFYAVATNIQAGREVVFGQGNTGTAVRASCSVPGVFTPVEISGQWYVDGGVVSPVAVDAARKLGADMVIAVDISSDIDPTPPEGTVDTILHSINIMYSKVAAAQLERADVVVKPRVGRIASGDFTKRHEAILEGEKAAYEALPKINETLARLREPVAP